MSEADEEKRVRDAAVAFATAMGASFFRRFVNGEVTAGQFADEFVKVWRLVRPPPE